MKHIFAVYGFIGLLLLAILSVLSYSAGFGYIYILWHGVQIQTNIWFVSFFLLFTGLIFQITWRLTKRYLNREKRKIQQVDHFNTLHTYEQLGVLWILEGEAEKQDFIEPVFEPSGLLKNIVQARGLTKNEHFDEALNLLQQSPADAFELAEIQRIEIFLAQGDAEQALTHLEFLHGHDLSPWLQNLSDIYQQRLNHLWGRFAVLFPWDYLRATQYGHLEAQAKQLWLSRLLSEFDNASTNQWQLLMERYHLQQAQIQTASFEIKMLWLKLLSRIPEMAESHCLLAIGLLEESFDQDVFYLWFQQQLLKQVPDYESIEQQIKHLELKYLSLPVFSFALWHIYMETGRENQAEELLLLYPDNILMNYLRIKSTLNGDASLIQQLNTVFEKDANFMQVKI